MSSQKKCAVGDWNLKMTHIQNSSQIKAEDVLCGSCIQPKKQFKVQIIGILEEIDSFY